MQMHSSAMMEISLEDVTYFPSQTGYATVPQRDLIRVFRALRRLWGPMLLVRYFREHA